jgi:murein DD-endopeptidase MepM/ murein hydrolase activator NlpD
MDSTPCAARADFAEYRLVTFGDFMLQTPIFVLFVCLALHLTAYEATAKLQQVGKTEYSAQTKKAAKTAVPQKESAKAKVAGNAKKSSKKQITQVSAKPKVKNKAPNGRKFAKASRDPASLPDVQEGFTETPHSLLMALSTIPVEGSISSTYGVRRLSGKKKRVRMHSGVDISAPRGTPVLAAASGVVFFAGHWAAYGKIVEIDHGNGLVTRYAHLDTKNVETGARVASGQAIGAVGRSGRTTGAHLHFETLVNGRTVDPMMAEIWRQTSGHLATKSGTYVSGLRSSAKPVY